MLYGGKMYVIVVYDISVDDNGQRRWNKVFKLCKQYLHHVQNSVFEGEINEANLYKLSKKLEAELNKEVDSLIVFKSRNERWVERMFLGKKEESKLFI